ncbi:SMI1/KNR4 family protein [Streptomyces sp. NPDC054765]
MRPNSGGCDVERVFVFRTERRWDGAEAWESGPWLRAGIDRSVRSPLDWLGWRTRDGAEAAVGFKAAMEGFYGYYRAADGRSAEYRGELERCEAVEDGAARRFRTEESRGEEWHAAGDWWILLEDGGAHVERLDWHDQAGASGSMTLRAAVTEPGLTSEVTALVGTVRAHHEYEVAGEVADNVLNGSHAKWLGNWGMGGAWLEFRLVRPAVVRYYVLASANDCPDRDPMDWTLQGSHDGRQWTALDSRTGQVFTRRHQPRGFAVTGTTGMAYQHYRLEITANAGSVHVQLSQARLFDTAPDTAFEGFFGYRQRAGQSPSGFRGAPMAPAPEGTALRTVEEWRAYLFDYSADVIRVTQDRQPGNVSDEQRAAGWLGYEGASKERLAALEERLGTRLPPSYRAFLGASDGWLQLSSFMWEMRTTDTVAWLTETDAAGLADFYDEADEDDEEGAVLGRSLLISQDGDAQYWLLDPGDVSGDGEWAAYIWASWYPGLGERHASFAELVQAERASFERLKGREGHGVHPEGAEDLVTQGREQALRGEAEQALASFDRAEVKGSGVGMYLKTILGAFLDLRFAHHEIRNNIFGRDHVIAAVGEDQVRAEALPLYLRRTVEEHGPLVGLPRLEILGRLVPELSFSEGESNNDWIERAAAHVPPRLPEPPAFEQALHLARSLAAQGDDEEAWTVIEAALPRWYSDNPHRIAPVILLTDPVLRGVITPHRAQLVVRIPCGKVFGGDTHW